MGVHRLDVNFWASGSSNLQVFQSNTFQVSSHLAHCIRFWGGGLLGTFLWSHLSLTISTMHSGEVSMWSVGSAPAMPGETHYLCESLKERMSGSLVGFKKKRKKTSEKTNTKHRKKNSSTTANVMKRT